MGIIAFIILGLLAGAIAKAIMPGDDPGGYIVTAIIGIVVLLALSIVAAQPQPLSDQSRREVGANGGSMQSGPYCRVYWTRTLR